MLQKISQISTLIISLCLIAITVILTTPLYQSKIIPEKLKQQSEEYSELNRKTHSLRTVYLEILQAQQILEMFDDFVVFLEDNYDRIESILNEQLIHMVSGRRDSRFEMRLSRQNYPGPYDIRADEFGSEYRLAISAFIDNIQYAGIIIINEFMELQDFSDFIPERQHLNYHFFNLVSSEFTEDEKAFLWSLYVSCIVDWTRKESGLSHQFEEKQREFFEFFKNRIEVRL